MNIDCKQYAYRNITGSVGVDQVRFYRSEAGMIEADEIYKQYYY